MKKIVLSSIALTMGAMAFGQLSVVDGNTRFDFGTATNFAGTSGTTMGGSGANFRTTGATGIDQFFQQWWAYRVGGQTREFNVLSPGAVAVTGSGTNQATFTIVNAADQLQMDFKYTAQATSATAGRVNMDVRVTNLAGTNRTLNWFFYADLDVNGSAGSDVSVGAIESQGRRITVTEGAQTANVFGGGAKAWALGATWPAVRNELMSNATITNFNDTLANHTGDMNGGFQWECSLAPGAVCNFSVGAAAGGAQAVPEPATLAALGLGGLALVRRRRKS